MKNEGDEARLEKWGGPSLPCRTLQWRGGGGGGGSGSQGGVQLGQSAPRGAISKISRELRSQTGG